MAGKREKAHVEGGWQAQIEEGKAENSKGKGGAQSQRWGGFTFQVCAPPNDSVYAWKGQRRGGPM